MSVAILSGLSLLCLLLLVVLLVQFQRQRAVQAPVNARLENLERLLERNERTDRKSVV